MKDTLKKSIFALIIIIITIILAISFKYYLNKNHTNTSDKNNFFNTISISSNSSFELTEAIVTKVIDGDTVWVTIDNKEYKFRFIGINCPEYTKKIEPFGKEATEFTTSVLLGKTVYLQKDISDTDKYDRLLRYVWTSKIDEITKDNISNYLFNAKLVKSGLAFSIHYEPDTLLQNYLDEYQKNAKDNKIGMWQ